MRELLIAIVATVLGLFAAQDVVNAATIEERVDVNINAMLTDNPFSIKNDSRCPGITQNEPTWPAISMQTFEGTACFTVNGEVRMESVTEFCWIKYNSAENRVEMTRTSRAGYPKGYPDNFYPDGFRPVAPQPHKADSISGSISRKKVSPKKAEKEMQKAVRAFEKTTVVNHNVGTAICMSKKGRMTAWKVASCTEELIIVYNSRTRIMTIERAPHARR